MNDENDRVCGDDTADRKICTLGRTPEQQEQGEGAEALVGVARYPLG